MGYLLVAAHNVIIPAFVGDSARLYSIDLALAADRKGYWFRHTRWVKGHETRSDAGPPRVALAGSGGAHLKGPRRWWMRNVLRLVNAHDRGQISAMVVSDHLATLTDEVHRASKDGTVGPTCIVAWRHRPGGRYRGGGSHQSYTGTARDSTAPFLPSIATGIDMIALSKVLMPRSLELMRRGDMMTPYGTDELDAELAALPDKPDEDLR